MPIFDRRRQCELEQLVADYRQQGFSRRTFLQRAMAAGLTTYSALALLTACSNITAINPDTNITSTRPLDVLSVWSDVEKDSFKAVISPFTRETNIHVNIETTRDLDEELSTRILAKAPPDIAILPNPGKMQQLASENQLIPLDTFLNMEAMHKVYREIWIELGSYQKKFYAIFYKVANKATIWYSPRQFQAIDARPASTWSELIELSEDIARSGKYPWSMGIKSGATSGWPAADWVAQIYLNQSGPELYDQWVKHKIPWTHESIQQAFRMFGQIIGGKHFIKDAPHSITDTDFQKASTAPFTTPPQAYMYYLGDFTSSFILKDHPKLEPEIDFNFFPFPTINPNYAGAITAGADVVVAMKESEEVHKLINYLTTAEAQSIWVKRGGFTSVNQSILRSMYPNSVMRASVKILEEAPILRYGAGDLMPPGVQKEFWRGLITFIEDQKQLDTILQDIEVAAQQARYLSP